MLEIKALPFINKSCVAHEFMGPQSMPLGYNKAQTTTVIEHDLKLGVFPNGIKHAGRET